MDAFDALGIKDDLKRALSDSFNLYMHTLTLASVSFQQENPKKFALAIIGGWGLSYAEMREEFLEGKEDIMTKLYGDAFDETLREFTQTMKDAVESGFPKKKQDIGTFFQPFKSKE